MNQSDTKLLYQGVFMASISAFSACIVLGLCYALRQWRTMEREERLLDNIQLSRMNIGRARATVFINAPRSSTSSSGQEMDETDTGDNETSTTMRV